MRISTYLVLFVAIIVAATCSAQTANPPTADSTYRIFGIVVDLLSNQPISGARVIISPVNERNSARSAITSSNGSFLFDHLSRGKYSLGAEYHGYPIQGYDQHEGYATAIAVGPDLDSEHILFRLRPGSTIRGTVTNDENEPVEGASVRLFTSSIINGRSATRQVQTRTTDDRGDYSFPHLPEGIYFIAVSGAPWYLTNSVSHEQARTQGVDSEALARLEQEESQLNFVYPLTFYSGSTSPEEATPIHLAAGERANADISLHAVRPVRLRVQEPPPEPHSEPVEGRGMVTFSSRRLPQVRLTQEVFGEALEVPTGGSEIPGQMEFSNIPPGHYSVTLIQPGQTDTTGTTQELDLTSDMDLPTAGGVSSANVSGVVFSDADPKDLMLVRLFAKDHRRGFTARIADGKFRIEVPVPPGTYEVGIGSTSDDQYIKSLVATGAKIKGRSIQIVAGQPVQLSLTMGRGMTRIEGLATNDGKPIAGAMILLVPNDLENDSLLLRRDQSDSDGTFTLSQVVPGKYKVVAIQDGWKISWADPKTIQPYLKSSTEVSVSGAATMNVKVAVQLVK